MLLSDEFDLQTLLDEQAAEFERQELEEKLGKFDMDSAFDRIGSTMKKEEAERKAAEKKEAEENKYAYSSRSARDSNGVRERSDDDYVFMTSHKARHNPMNSYEAMQALIGNSEEEDEVVNSKYSSSPTSEGIDWQARLGQKKQSRFSSTRSSSRSTSSSPSSSSSSRSRSSRRSSLWDDVEAPEPIEVNDSMFDIDWSALGSSIFSF
jgi:hypothetical protein